MKAECWENPYFSGEEGTGAGSRFRGGDNRGEPESVMSQGQMRRVS